MNEGLIGHLLVATKGQIYLTLVEKNKMIVSSLFCSSSGWFLLCLLCGAASRSVASLIDIPDELPKVSLNRPRSERFPSKEERVKLYMSNWYVPNCEDSPEGAFVYEPLQDPEGWPQYTIQEPFSDNSTVALNLDSSIHPDTAFVLDRQTVMDCAVREGDPKLALRVEFRTNMYMYCLDVARSVLPAYFHTSAPDDAPPIVLQFGDLKHSHDFGFVQVPHLKKFRRASPSPKALEAVTMYPPCLNGTRLPLIPGDVLQPIVWKLATRRHYGYLDHVGGKDRPWAEKKDMAVFRGQLTGSRDGYDKKLSALENCQNLIRCRLVYNHAQSDYVNAKLTNTRGRLPETLNGVNLTTDSVTVRHLLRYKGIIMLEGNDVASGLKWALLSASVVLMPIPKHTSWAMEERLVPWVHYVPLNDEATDIEEKMKWVVSNDEPARRISYAATRWMQDLVYHPDALEDDRWIQEEIMRRYQRLYKSKRQQR